MPFPLGIFIGCCFLVDLLGLGWKICVSEWDLVQRRLFVLPLEPWSPRRRKKFIAVQLWTLMKETCCFCSSVCVSEVLIWRLGGLICTIIEGTRFGKLVSVPVLFLFFNFHLRWLDIVTNRELYGDDVNGLLWNKRKFVYNSVLWFHIIIVWHLECFHALEFRIKIYHISLEWKFLWFGICFHFQCLFTLVIILGRDHCPSGVELSYLNQILLYIDFHLFFSFNLKVANYEELCLQGHEVKESYFKGKSWRSGFPNNKLLTVNPRLLSLIDFKLMLKS